MSVEAEFQKHVHDLLKADSDLNALIGGRVYDRIEQDKVQHPYISFGPHEVISDDADCIVSGEHTLQLDVWSEAVGSVEAKQIVDRAKKVLHDNTTQIFDNAIVFMRVPSTRVMRDRNGLTTHGILTIQADIEEA